MGKKLVSLADNKPSNTDLETKDQSNIEERQAVPVSGFVDLSNQFVSPRRGTREILTLYTDSPWLRAIVNKIAKSVADTQWELFAAKSGSGRFVLNQKISRTFGDKRKTLLSKAVLEDEAAQIISHPLLDLLENGTGDPRLPGFGGMQITASHIDLVGEAHWLLERNNIGTPIAFWPLPPHWVRKFPNRSNPNYQINTASGLVADIPATEIITFIDPDPADPYGRGTGIARSLDDEIQIDEFSAKHQKGFFLNRARPDIIISGQFLSREDAVRLERKWLSDHQGFWRAFKPLFFSNKIDVKELSQTFESMQMVQIRKHERDTFISVFGAPPEKFGVIGESKRSTIAAADHFWNKDVIKPRVEHILRTLQLSLVPIFDERLILSYDTPVIQEDEFKQAVIAKHPYAFTLNRIRELAGDVSLGPAGEVLPVPTNIALVPVKDANNMPASPEQMYESQMHNIEVKGQNVTVLEDADRIAETIGSSIIGVLTDFLSDRKKGE